MWKIKHKIIGFVFLLCSALIGMERDSVSLLEALARGDKKNALALITQQTANARDIFGYSALHYAVLIDNKLAIEKLIECGAQPSYFARGIETPYVIAIKHARANAFTILKQHAKQWEINKGRAELRSSADSLRKSLSGK